jgi:acylphosphatase
MRVARRFLIRGRVIRGRVQGVGFRYFTESVAAREGLHGWVTNLPGGHVEARVEGEAEAVERFERAIRHGPPGARVDDVEVEDEAPNGRESGFTVR